MMLLNPPLLLVLSIAILVILIVRQFEDRLTRLFHRRNVDQNDTSILPAEKDPYQNIEPLLNFDWKNEAPLRNSPLKPKYYLTMAVEQISLSNLIAMDSTYLSRTAIRRQIIHDHYAATIQCNPPCAAAVYELYAWIFSTYLPQRFPSIYHLNHNSTGLINTATSRTIPLFPLPPTPQDALRVLGENVDTDFLLLLPSSSTTVPDGTTMPIYHLEAFVTCFPTGFSTRQKLGLPLAQIHAPVPGYKAKLEKSMDRFFAKLECGKCVKRGNWSLTTNPDLFAEKGNHLYADGKTEVDVREVTETVEKESLQAEIDRQKGEVVVEECRLRSERQTLFRLPKSKAIVFSFKTYQYTMDEVKKDGYAEDLAQAMEGLQTGNVPEMDVYKRGVVWRDPLIQYLRSPDGQM